MRATSLAVLKQRIRGDVRFAEPLAAYTTYRIGGPAAVLVQPASVDDVVAAVSFARETETPWLALGLGSNVLVSDDGFDGIVIRVGKGMDEVTQGIGGESWVWRVGAGLPTPQLARRSAKAGLAGVHRLVGVPGSVGGGVFMNAGAHGQDFSKAVRSVDLVGGDGSARSILGGEIPWRYRSSGLGRCVVTSATIGLEPRDPAGLDRDIRKHLAWRKAGTPFNEPCCGSVFRNPTSLTEDQPSRTAGQLIDALGLKGFKVGGAQVSTLHANYIVNTGNATAGNVMAVIDEVRNRVMVEYGVELELEVQILGET
ncbi:MAG: UDP-N-acetylmuramate dehydrogenase [Gemmatimonadota bacterium]|nr:UDP-N-acetylmuramate dehydrogenase [Gemmatimonadota bacterium]